MIQDQKKIEISNHNEIVQRDDQIVAAIDKDAFRAMFYLFAGKPDSKHESFSGKVTISPGDIIDLNKAIYEKFKLHNITQIITTVSMSVENNQNLRFWYLG